MPKEDEIVAARAKELAERSADSFRTSRFLTPHEQAVFFRAVAGMASNELNRLFFYGGCRGAERRTAVFFPEWADVSDAPRIFPDSPLYYPEREEYLTSAVLPFGGAEVHGLSCVRIEGSGYRPLGHRDYLGSLLALGVERDAVGDILTDGTSAARVFVLKTVAPIITSDLDRVGSDKVRVAVEDPPPDITAEPKREPLSAVSASMRLDAVVGSVFFLSRSEAKEAVEKALVEVNYMTEQKAERTLAPGDVVSVRGFGKFSVGEQSGLTRSGKVRVTVEKYV